MNMDNEIKAGLEIHQQLDTHKLFCKCPSILRNDKPDYVIKRKLHAVAGESGEIDVAAKFEAGQDREFIYQGYDSNCLVELDEEPPYEINLEALKIGLHIALLLNCKIIPITQIMRKTVIDGSNTSGFQRTVLIAKEGYIETSFGKVRIENISLEEDSARKINKEFRLDRLGIPLIEIGTYPDIKNKEQLKEAALIIGDILRSCKIKRGIGTIRQDINISINNHPRVEIKGFQDIKMFIPVVENEIKRQKENIQNKKLKNEVRKALPNGKTEFLRPMPGASRMYPETDLPLLKISKNLINESKRTLPKLREEIKKELERKGLSNEMIKILIKKNKLEEFKSLLKILNEPVFIYKILIEIPKEVASHEKKDINLINLDIIESIVQAILDEKIEKSDVKQIMKDILNGKSFTEAIKIEKSDLSEIESRVARLIKEKPGLSIKAYMGLIMREFKGVSGKQVNEVLQKLINK